MNKHVHHLLGGVDIFFLECPDIEEHFIASFYQ